MAGRARDREEGLPVNHEAERTVLGYLLAGGAWPAEVSVRDFSLETHQILWRAMNAIHTAGERIELPRLKIQLTEKELNYIRIGYLAELVSSGCYAEMSIGPYVAKLKEATCKRDILHHTHIFSAHIHSNDCNAAELVAMGREAFAKLGREQSLEEPAAREAGQNILPAFPEIAWRGLFQDYRTAMKGTTEACDEAHFATFWSVCGAILGRKVSMVSGDVIYCNTYIVVHGPSGDKKTTAERRIIRCRLLEDHPRVKFIAGVGSAEGLAEKLDGGGSALFFWEEFASMLSRARWTGSTLLEFITECFDCPGEWHNHYRKDPIHLEEPTPSILTATTPEWFWKHAKAEDFFGGFGNRFIVFTGLKKPALADPVEVNGEIIHRIKEQLKVLAGRPARRAEWTEGAAKVWREFYVRFESQERQGLLGAALKRVHIYVRKLAMTYAWLEDTLPYVHTDQLKAAIAAVEHSALSMERLLDLQAASSKPFGELEQLFLKWITKHEGERVRRLQQLMWKYCGDSETFNRVLRSLVIADRIEIRDRRVFSSV